MDKSTSHLILEKVKAFETLQEVAPCVHVAQEGPWRVVTLAK